MSLAEQFRKPSAQRRSAGRCRMTRLARLCQEYRVIEHGFEPHFSRHRERGRVALERIPRGRPTAGAALLDESGSGEGGEATPPIGRYRLDPDAQLTAAH